LLEAVLSVGSAPSIYGEDPRPAEKFSYWIFARTVRTRMREVEESPLFEAFAREWLLKTQQDGKKLSGCCGDM
jgi:hypothetical protein